MPCESFGVQNDPAILADIEMKVDTLVDSKSRHQPVLMVHMRAQRAYTIRGKDVILH
jgi:hypothetical protein